MLRKHLLGRRSMEGREHPVFTVQLFGFSHLLCALEHVTPGVLISKTGMKILPNSLFTLNLYFLSPSLSLSDPLPSLSFSFPLCRL